MSRLGKVDAGSKETMAIQLILDRLWSSYSLVDERRRRSFYQLFYGMAVFAVLWSTREQFLELPFVNARVDLVMAVAVAPSFILVLVSKYLYLSAYTVITYSTYLFYLYRGYSKELEIDGLGFSNVYNTLRQRDMTENLNLFLLPLGFDPNWDSPVPLRLKRVMALGVNLTIIMVGFAPIGAYFFLVQWLASTALFGTSELLKLVVAIYLVLGLILFATPAYLYFRVRPARNAIKSRTWQGFIEHYQRSGYGRAFPLVEPAPEEK